MKMPFENTDPVRLLVLGASGQIGRALHLGWAGAADLAPLWQKRGRTETVTRQEWLVWDILREPLPRTGPLEAVLMLAGSAQGGDAALQAHRDLALAALAAARQAGARHLFVASSAAVYGSGPLRRETGPAVPRTSYGAAKLAMEEDLRQAREAGGPGVTCLRIGNVAGADALLTNAAIGPVEIDQTGTGRGPGRSYIGPEALAEVLARLVRLACRGTDLPFRLNVAQPGPVHMEELAQAWGADWRWRAASPDALEQLTLDTGRLTALVPLPPADPIQLAAEAQRIYGIGAADRAESRSGAGS